MKGPGSPLSGVSKKNLRRGGTRGKGEKGMKLHTASETIRFIRGLEESSAAFYEELAKEFPDRQELFLAFANENRRYVQQVQRTYQSVISDAIEGCFSFDLDTEHFVLDTALCDGASLSEAAGKAIAMEERILQCYRAGAEQSGPLLADVPRSFRFIVKKRQGRLDSLSCFR